jgi:hypothetical protein
MVFLLDFGYFIVSFSRPKAHDALEEGKEICMHHGVSRLYGAQ